MTENDRLLTKKERDEVYLAISNDAKCNEERRAFCKAQDTKSLRAVGKWIKREMEGWLKGDPHDTTPSSVHKDMNELAASLLRGEMPDDAP